MQERRSRVRPGVLLTALVMAVVCPSALPAQSVVSGALEGRVLDGSGAAVTAARVVLRRTDAAVQVETWSDSTGRYVFARVEPGSHYEVDAESRGFKKATAGAVTISVAQVAHLDIVLEPGEVTEGIVVTAEPRVVQATQSSVSTLVDGRQLRELPLNGKNFQRLTVLVPGFGGQGTDQANPLHTSINGARPSGNTFMLDGINFNDERFSGNASGEGGASRFSESAPNVVSSESVAEYRVITANADATFGRGSGAQVNLITRQGSNRVSASAYEYARDDRFDARDFFNTGPFFDDRGAAVPPPFRQHVFGGAVGLPMRRDRHFLFASYEGFRQQREVSFNPVVPNATLLGLIPGDLGRFYRTYFTGIVPAANEAGTFSPLSATERAAAVARGFDPALFDGALGNEEAGTLLLSTTRTNDVDQDSGLVRTDSRLSSHVQISARYLQARTRQLNARGFDPIESLNTTYQGMAQGLLVLSPRQTLEARLGLNRNRFADGLEGGRVPDRFSGVALPLNGYGLTVSGVGGTFPSVFMNPVASRVPQQVTQLTVVHTASLGTGLLRSGVELRAVDAGFRRGFSEAPTYDFRGFIGPTGLLGNGPGQPQAIADVVTGSTFGNNGSPADSLRRWNSLQQEYFSQLDLRLAPTLTVNAGVRYSYYGVFTERDGWAANLFARDASGAVVADVSPFAFGRTANVVQPIGDGQPLYQPDRNNLQPRVGAAWDITGDGRSVLRGAYGLFTDRIFQGQFALNLGNGPYAVSSLVLAEPFLLGTSFPVNPNVPAVWAVDPTLRNPTVHQFNVTVERAIGKQLGVSIAYVGLRGRDLVRAEEPNGSGAVPQALRPDPRFSDQRFVTNGGRADYDALQLFARRRLSDGLTFTVAYTLADMKDDVWTDYIVANPRTPSLVNVGADPVQAGVQGGGSAFAPRDFSRDYADSEYEVAQDLSASFLYELPFGSGKRFLSGRSLASALLGGWSLGGVVQWRSGEPVHLTLGRDADDDGDASRDRPALFTGTLDDLYASGGARTQYLLSQTEALTRLGASSTPTDLATVVPRNALVGPRLTNLDLSLLRRVSLGPVVLQAEVNAFNVLNVTNLGAPIANLSDPRFGRIVALRRGTNPRQLQFGLRMSF